MTVFSPFEKQLMLNLIRQSLRYKGKTFPNPVVGAAVYQKNTLISTGYHQGNGLAHAEAVALKKAGQQSQGASLMVTLSPCTHYGKTPPCVDAIINAGISKVIFPLIDIHPATTIRNIVDVLKEAGIQVMIGLCKENAFKANAGYFSSIAHQKPLIHLKVGMSLDGMIADQNYPDRYITSDTSLKQVHRLRREMQAIIVGIGTILTDDPQLNIRYRLYRKGYTLPKRIILDPMGRTPLSARVLDPQYGGDTIICISSRCPSPNKKRLRSVATVWELPETAYGLDWHPLLQKLGDLNLQDVLIEGGQKIFSSALSEQIVDWGHFFIAPIILGSPSACPAFHLPAFQSQTNTPRLYHYQQRQCGPDLYVSGALKEC